MAAYHNMQPRVLVLVIYLQLSLKKCGCISEIRDRLSAIRDSVSFNPSPEGENEKRVLTTLVFLFYKK